MGWACYLAPVPPTPLTDAEQAVPASVQMYANDFATWETAYDTWKIKDYMAMGIIKGTLHGQYLTYVLSCTMLKVVWDIILSRLRMQNLGLAAHNTKQLLYNYPYLGGSIKDYLRHFAVTNKQLIRIGKVIPNSEVAHWMLENLPKEDLGWKSVITSFYMVNPDLDLVSLFQVSVAIRNHYNQLMALPAHSVSTYVAPTFKSMFAAHHGCPSGSTCSLTNSNHPYCTSCNKPGHMVDKCFNAILAEIDKLNTCLPCSLQLSLPAKPERANVALDGSGAVCDIVDDWDVPDDDDNIVLLTMALKRGDVFISELLSNKARSAYQDHVYVDSGATHSISPVIEHFNPVSLKQLKALIIICVGNNKMLLAMAVGNIPYLFNVGDIVRNGVVFDVLYCADIAMTLISASQLNACGHKVILDGSESCIVHKPLDKTVACMHLTKLGLYHLNASPCLSKVFVSLTMSL